MLNLVAMLNDQSRLTTPAVGDGPQLRWTLREEQRYLVPRPYAALTHDRLAGLSESTFRSSPVRLHAALAQPSQLMTSGLLCAITQLLA